ncbi:hypothetical protein GCM10020229_80700 [Kitasatospora albolonga]
MPVMLRLVPSPGERVRLPGHLRYAAADPYAVRLDCWAGPGAEAVRWTFARELLATGLRERSGVGRVTVSPPTAVHPEHLVIVLRGSASTAALLVPAAVVREFLAVTERLVPTGTEHRYAKRALRLLLGPSRSVIDRTRPCGWAGRRRARAGSTTTGAAAGHHPSDEVAPSAGRHRGR